MKTGSKESRAPDVGNDSALAGQIIAKLRSLRNERNIAGMRRFAAQP